MRHAKQAAIMAMFAEFSQNEERAAAKSAEHAQPWTKVERPIEVDPLWLIAARKKSRA